MTIYEIIKQKMGTMTRYKLWKLCQEIDPDIPATTIYRIIDRETEPERVIEIILKALEVELSATQL